MLLLQLPAPDGVGLDQGRIHTPTPGLSTVDLETNLGSSLPPGGWNRVKVNIYVFL